MSFVENFRDPSRAEAQGELARAYHEWTQVKQRLLPRTTFLSFGSYGRIFDANDQVELLLLALQEPAGDILKEKIRHLLIDDFQDCRLVMTLDKA